MVAGYSMYIIHYYYFYQINYNISIDNMLSMIFSYIKHTYCQDGIHHTMIPNTLILNMVLYTP